MPRNFARNLNRKNASQINDGSAGRYREAEDERAVLESEDSVEAESSRSASTDRRQGDGDETPPHGDPMDEKLARDQQV